MPSDFVEDYVQNRFLYLLVSLLLLVALGPVFQDLFSVSMVDESLFTVIMLSGIWAVGERLRHRILAIVLAIPMLISIWISYLVPGVTPKIWADLFSIVFMTYTMLVLLTHVFSRTVVTRDIILCAIIVYLLLGVLWGLFFTLLEMSAPASLAIPEASTNLSTRFTYFSFVTLTTLGYGDITPVSAAAKSLVILEALFGQLYLAVVIARLVALYVAQSVENREPS